eukprot:3147398-Pleurochrysis_carterae.AAC.1
MLRAASRRTPEPPARALIRATHPAALCLTRLSGPSALRVAPGQLPPTGSGGRPPAAPAPVPLERPHPSVSPAPTTRGVRAQAALGRERAGCRCASRLS